MSIGNFNTDNIAAHTTILLWSTWILTAGLFVAGFICPPRGEIHSSLLQAGCILMAILGIIVAREGLKEGFGARISHGDVTVEIKDLDQSE